MNNHAIKWLYAVPEKKKLYIHALMTVQALNGASGVLYALLLRNILRKDFASVNAVHSGEWLNRLTNDTVVVADSYVEILPGLVGICDRVIDFTNITDHPERA